MRGEGLPRPLPLTFSLNVSNAAKLKNERAGLCQLLGGERRKKQERVRTRNTMKAGKESNERDKTIVSEPTTQFNGLSSMNPIMCSSICRRERDSGILLQNT